MDIEKLATSAVDASISKTERLSSFINSGDKEPCWDGTIYIHEDKKHNKKNIKRVSAQVKGKLVRSKDVKEKIKYQISYDDLNAYMMNGGTMFFVVYLNCKTGEELQIYYASLLPLRIKKIISTIKKRYSIQFKKFPNDNIQKTELLLNFYNDALRQTSFAGREIPSIEELSKSGLLESISFHYTGLVKNISPTMLPKMMDGKSLTLYANIKGNSIPIPIEYYDSINQIQMHCDNNWPVSVADTKFYDDYKIVTTADHFELHIGSCLCVVFPIFDEEQETVDSINVKIDIKGTLKERITGVSFVLASIKEGMFYIGEYPMKFDISKDDLEKIDIHFLESSLNSYRRVQEFLDNLNVKKDLDFDNCTVEDIRKLNILVPAIENKMIVNEQIDDSSAQLKKVVIANINLAVICISETSEGYRIFDYFGNHFNVDWLSTEDEKPLRISQFSMINSEDFLELSNLNLKEVVSDFDRIEANSLSVEFANKTMLEILKAYDVSSSDDLLIAAKEISDWIKLNAEYIPEDVSTINELQIVLRERALSFEEKLKLHRIIENSNDPFFRAGAFLLLKEYNEVVDIFKTFTDEQLDTFKSFPIYRFYKDFTEETSNGQT